VLKSLSTAAGIMLLLWMSSLQAAEKPRIAIIIDDLGYAAELGRRVTELPGPVACAVLPSTPLAVRIAEAANAAGKEVLLHLPLEAIGPQARTDPGVISLDMTRGQFARTFSEDIRSVPHASGVNSHRGSLLTQHPGHMTWLMEEISTRGDLFFVDSYTTHESVALMLAIESGVPALKRDVFLDPDKSPETVAREFQRLIDIARERGMAVAIGHPYPATIELLERELPKLNSDGIELVSIRELLSIAAKQVDGRQAGLVQTRKGDGLVR
jgi:polysaccharide deacetylase 2 family uncharacterized protein YibQ